MWLKVSAILGASAVLCGAFGAHGLADRVAPDELDAWKTGALYHLVHALAVLALGLVQRFADRPVSLPAALFTGGVACFSGSIYLLVLTDQSWLGPVTPLGGLTLTAGWLSLLRLARD